MFSSLNDMTNGEIIDDFRCDGCEMKVQIKKKTVVKRLPNTMIVNLQRIAYDMETNMQVKMNDRLEFPKMLNMRTYMLEEVMKKEKKAA